MNANRELSAEHTQITRRHFLELGAMGAAGLSAIPIGAQAGSPESLAEVTAKLEYLTREENFANVGRGNPPPCDLPLEKRREVGLTPETWELEVLADPESDSKVEHPLSKALGTALKWDGLMKLAEKQAVRFLHVVSCTNGNKPFGIGLWEGVPLREVIWMARPGANVRRLFYYGYHNDDPKQRFQSSLTIDRVLEDPPGELPVILCYKLNGQWLTPKRGGPVRMVAPDLYANKSVKWLQRVLLTNKIQLNDTYAEWNNDTESHLKTCGFFINPPKTAKAGRPVPITGLAQVGMSGLKKVQYCIRAQDAPWPSDDPYLIKADWQDAEILPAPNNWGGGLADGKLPAGTLGMAASGQPQQWPMRNSITHWAVMINGLTVGKYELRCRTIDASGNAQPMPRPMVKSGNNALEKATLTVEA